MSSTVKLFRTATVAMSLDLLLKGQLKYLNQSFDVTAISGADDHLFKVKEREGVKTIGITMSREIDIKQDIKSLWRLYQTFKREKPTIVHSITPKAGLLTMVAGKLAGVPIRIHTFTGLVFPSKTGKLQQLLIKMDQILCASATHIIPEGEGVKNDLITYKITNKRLDILANGNVNGVDLSYFSKSNFSTEQLNILRNQIGLSKEKKTFVFVGRLVRDKGINELIEALKKLDSNQVQLLLVGPYEDKDPLQSETIQYIQNANNIFELGFQADVRPYFALSDLLVFPSYREGFPNVVLQAGAMDLPAIVTDISGSNEIIEDGVNGIIISKQDVNALYEAMITVIQNAQLLNKMASTARKLIADRYDQTVVWDATKQYYLKALNEKGISLD